MFERKSYYNVPVAHALYTKMYLNYEYANYKY